MDFPKGLCWPDAGPGALQAVPGEARDTVSALRAGLDVRDAQTLAPTCFPTEFFDGRDGDGVAHALATLMLAQWVAPRHEAMQGIVPSPPDARLMLSEHDTPTGQAALWQSVAGGHGENAFAQHLGQADRYGLAGHLWRQRANAGRMAGAPDPSPEEAGAQAAEAYQQAAGCYARAGLPELAAEAYRQAAERYLQTHQRLKAANASRQGAALYAQTRQWVKAAHARRQAAVACLKAANGYWLAGAPALAADAYLKAGELYRQAHQPHKAVHACLSAVNAYRRTGQLGQAAAAYQQAARAAHADADARRGEERYRLAADAYRRVAELYAHLGQPGLAADAWAEAAAIYTRARAPQKAQWAYRQGTYAARADVIVWRRAVDISAALDSGLGLSSLVTHANCGAGHAYQRLGLVLRSAGRPRHEAAEAFRSAADHYAKAQAYTQAAAACEALGDWPQAAHFYGKAQHFAQAAECYAQAHLFAQASHVVWGERQRSANPLSQRKYAHEAKRLSAQAELQSARFDRNL